MRHRPRACRSAARQRAYANSFSPSSTWRLKASVYAAVLTMFGTMTCGGGVPGRQSSGQLRGNIFTYMLMSTGAESPIGTHAIGLALELHASFKSICHSSPKVASTFDLWQAGQLIVRDALSTASHP